MLIKIGIGVLGVGILISALYRYFNKPKPAGVFVQVRCTECSWKGTVGKYNRKCPQCNSTKLRDIG